MQLLPEGIKLMPQVEGDFGERLLNGVIDLLAVGHSGAILINSDSPTLPKLILRRAADAVLSGDNCVLGRSRRRRLYPDRIVKTARAFVRGYSLEH